MTQVLPIALDQEPEDGPDLTDSRELADVRRVIRTSTHESGSIAELADQPQPDIEEDEADVPDGAVRINGAQRLVRILEQHVTSAAPSRRRGDRQRRPLALPDVGHLAVEVSERGSCTGRRTVAGKVRLPIPTSTPVTSPRWPRCSKRIGTTALLGH